MSKDAAKGLADILQAISNIEVHLQGKRDFRLFQENITVHSAVERELMIIGEAVNRLLKTFPEIRITDAKRIVGLRNKMIHEYDIVDDAQLWNIIINHLPTLKRDATELLGTTE